MIFQKKRFVIIFALIAVMSWGLAFPFVKLGMQEFHIVTTGDKIVFAGLRFLLAGVCTLLIAAAMHKDFALKKKSDAALLALFGVVNTALHYFFFYIGLSNCPGSKSAIFDAISTFLLVLLACLFFKSDRMTVKKTIGCLCGAAGILVINLGNDFGGPISFMGEGMLLLNAICSAFGGIITRFVTKRVNAIVATGYSLSLGGALLLIVGALLGGKIHVVTVKGVLILCVLIGISTIGFILYNQLLTYNPVGEIAIFNALIPAFGTCFSCLFLKEPFYIKYVGGIVLIAVGIYLTREASNLHKNKMTRRLS